MVIVFQPELRKLLLHLGQTKFDAKNLFNFKNNHQEEKTNTIKEIIEAVKEGKFHIYAVSTIDEGIEILTGVPAGKKNKQGEFPAGTVNYLVQEKLKKYYKNSIKKD